MIEPLSVIPGDLSAPIFKTFRSASGKHLLVVPHSRIFDLTGDLAVDGDFTDMPPSLLAALADAVSGEVPFDNVVAPSPQSISLNVSSSCNLACSYCYAARGSFQGTQPEPMKWEVARAAIDTLLCGADHAAPVTIGFLGGEPFVNRRLLHRSVEYAAAQGSRRRLDVRFSVTTNGTLLNEDDVGLLRNHRFAVTVSVDGKKEIQNLQRPVSASQGSSYELLVAATRSLLANPGSAVVAARATVSRGDLNLPEKFEAILSLGFREIGFAPLRSAMPNAGALRNEDWPKYLEAIVGISQSELERVYNHHPIRLTNFAIALKQLYRGACSPYPCGAGGGYFSVAANGDWYACHRAIGTPTYQLGNNEGLDPERRREFLEARHVHAQPACRQCWARYLCSGGCHQEASSRTDSSCGFIRGWLEFCLGAYCELTRRKPDFFGTALS
jgi:uncharacterized protein